MKHQSLKHSSARYKYSWKCVDGGTGGGKRFGDGKKVSAITVSRSSSKKRRDLLQNTTATAVLALPFVAAAWRSITKVGRVSSSRSSVAPMLACWKDLAALRPASTSSRSVFGY